MNFKRLDHTLGIDDEGATQSQTLFFNVHTKSSCQLVCGVTNEWELRFANGRRGFVPHFV
jgi:hypothetical protein